MKEPLRKKKIVIAVAIIITVLTLIDAVLGLQMIIGHAGAEELEANAWILRRQASDNVLIQKEPGKQPYQYWRFWDNDPECGAELFLTGNSSGAWLECVALYLPEKPTGWVHSGFVVHDKPVPCGMVATVTRTVVAKESIGGRDAWECVPGERVKVLYRTDEWSTTIWGMIQTSALDFTVTGEVTQPRRAGWKDWTKRDHLVYAVDWW